MAELKTSIMAEIYRVKALLDTAFSYDNLPMIERLQTVLSNLCEVYDNEAELMRVIDINVIRKKAV